MLASPEERRVKMPQEASFTGQRKGSYSFSNDPNFSATPFNPVPLKYRKAADGTVLRDPANEGQGAVGDPQEQKCCKWCTVPLIVLISVVIGILLILVIVLPIALTQRDRGTKSDSDSTVDTSKAIVDSVPAVLGFFSATLVPSGTAAEESTGNSSRLRRSLEADSQVTQSTNTGDDFRSLLDAAINSGLREIGFFQIVGCSHADVTQSSTTLGVLAAEFLVFCNPNNTLATGLNLTNFDADVAVRDLSSTISSSFARAQTGYVMSDPKLDLDFTELCKSGLIFCDFDGAYMLTNKPDTTIPSSTTPGERTAITENTVVTEDATVQPTTENNVTSDSTVSFENTTTAINEVSNETLAQMSSSVVIPDVVIPTMVTVSATVATDITVPATVATDVTVPLVRTETPDTSLSSSTIPVVTVTSSGPRPCSSFGFTCLNGEKRVSENQVCDGFPDCADRSDELQCERCQTSFSCPNLSGGLVCLRGDKLCDGVPDCPGPAPLDEQPIYCHANCDPRTEFKCDSDPPKCIPLAWVCDGDKHCKGGEDEKRCAPKANMPTGCNNGAMYCVPDQFCIPKWLRCNGLVDCRNAADEMSCTCQECSGDYLTLCTPGKGMCIQRAKLCDGRVDCPNRDDEINCPGYCVPAKPIEMITCADGRRYAKRYACSGLEPACQSSCKECDSELAFQCRRSRTCISRFKVCDGVADCNDGSDEVPEICACVQGVSFFCETSGGKKPRCILPSQQCDGFRDCPEGDDEKKCSNCANNPNAFYCNVTKICYTSFSRCDGRVDCPDYRDEDGCTCDECKSKSRSGTNTFLCSSGRCLLQDYVCDSKSQYSCPGPTPEDKVHCDSRFGRPRPLIGF